MTDPAPLLSIVIPAHNEAGNLVPLLQEIAVALDTPKIIAGRYEVIIVDDGSTDATPAELQQATATDPRIRALTHARKTGMSASIRDAVAQARADWIMTCDGDRQNDPADMPRMLERGWGADGTGKAQNTLICGLRAHRRDSLKKRIASRIANGIRQAVLRDGCPDTGCALKLFRRDVYIRLPFFNGLHRFMPAMFRHYGATIINLPVNDRLRTVGVSKSDIMGRGLKGLADMAGVYWLLKRTPKG